MRGKNNHKTGAETEFKAAAYYTSLGYTVCWPMMTQSYYDFVVEKNGNFKRIQVKTPTWAKSGNYMYLQCRLGADKRNTSVTSSKGNKYRDSCDELIFIKEEEIWVFPSHILSYTSNVFLKSNNPSPNKSTRSYDPEEYKIKRKVTNEN